MDLRQLRDQYIVKDRRSIAKDIETTLVWQPYFWQLLFEHKVQAYAKRTLCRLVFYLIAYFAFYNTAISRRPIILFL